MGNTGNYCKRKCLHENRSSRVGYYTEGRKRCSRCGYNLKTDALRCYCCNTKLRTRPLDWSRRHKALESVPRY